MTRSAQASPRTTKGGRWLGWAVFVVGALYAVVSAYWAVGGTAGLDTLGGALAEMARARDPQLIVIVWSTVVLKLVGAVLGLALVQPWGRRVPRWLLLTASWGATVVLVLYGGVLVVAQSLIAVGVVPRASSFDPVAFYWHLFVWDPWFLLWGVLLGVATLRFARRRQDPGSHSANQG
ncbi:DUF3995 domain-containing protein [Saccharothrix sp. S26]|uniref:DUF3995 domain-containing protein n=1 Tax=Saccharothrix sp. S26 TaxID=2907215 RepID=UPI001F21A93A|nr:DUF3995 domain-containing protein [Saccharothrix sp. S26]MCE6995123.1 DUF3995 domain-containing protein [Saccharothrix sp. S26]